KSPAILPLRRRSGPVGEDDDAVRADGFRGGEVQRLRLTRVLEEALAGAQNDREDHQAVLVDEVVLHQGPDELGAAVDEDFALAALLQLRDLARDVAADHG